MTELKIPQIWSQTIANQVNTEEIIMALIKQIEKDFNFFNHQIKFTETAKENYFTLYNQLESYIIAFFGKNTEKLYPILYRIDVSEKDIRAAINSNFISSITETIILKELQKVIIKRFYKTT